MEPRNAKRQEPASPTSTQGLKLAIDLSPLLLFFGAYLLLGIYWATGTLMAATLLSMVASRVILGHISMTLIVTTVIVLGFGALTFWFNDPSFIKMKPTIVNLIFAAVLGAGLAMRRPLLQMLLGETLRLTAEGWRRLTVRWTVFFIAMAVLNEIVWRNFTEQTWASFKVFGILPLTLVFAMLQIGLIQRYAEPAAAQSDKPAD